MDFFASLPPEMVLNILSNLDGEDGVRCLAVSRLWRKVVGSQDGYWKKACVQFGLPEDLIEEHIQHKKCCASPVALFLAARRQRLYISGSSGMFARLEREAEECPSAAPPAKKKRRQYWQAPCRTMYVGNGYVVEVVYAKERPVPGGWGHSGYFPPHEEVAQTLLGRFNDRKIEKVCEISSASFNGRWFCVSPHHQCIVTVSRSHSTIDGSQRKPTKCLKQSITVKESLHTTSQPLLLPFPAGYDPSVPSYSEDMYSACSRCSMMVIAITVRPLVAMRLVDPSPPSTSLWHFNFIAFDQVGELALVHTEKVDFHVPHYPYKIALVPCPSSCLTTNICGSHNLILQAEQHVGIYQVETVTIPCLALKFKPLHFYEFEGENNKQFGFAPGTITVSSDEKLLGILCHPNTSAVLHLWSLTSFNCTKVGTVETDHNGSTLRALGHTYSIIHSSGHDFIHDTTVCVIATHTGETVWKFTKQVRSIIYHTPGYCMTRSQHEIEFLAVIKEDWLSNIHTVSPPLISFIVFSNFAEAVQGNLVIDGLSFQSS